MAKSKKSTQESVSDSKNSPAESPPDIAALPLRKPNPGQFQPGNTIRRGKPPRRVPNKLTSDLKQGIIDGAIKHGSNGKGAGGLVGYCYHLARRHPKAFAGLLGKIIPMQVTGNIGHHIDSVNIVSVPSDHFITSDDIARLAAPGLLELEPIEQDNEAEPQSTQAATAPDNDQE